MNAPLSKFQIVAFTTNPKTYVKKVIIHLKIILFATIMRLWMVIAVQVSVKPATLIIKHHENLNKLGCMGLVQ